MTMNLKRSKNEEIAIKSKKIMFQKPQSTDNRAAMKVKMMNNSHPFNMTEIEVHFRMESKFTLDSTTHSLNWILFFLYSIHHHNY
jgi:predicted transcriptional regulator